MTGPQRIGQDVLPVLVEQDVWDEFRDAVRQLGEVWTAPSGRRYRLELTGRRLEVGLEIAGMEPPPPGDDIDADLFVLAGRIYDAVGAEWSAEGLRNVARFWGWEPAGEASAPSG